MAQKEHSLSKFVILIICFITFGCNPKDKNANTIFEKVDVSQIPNITIFENDAKLKNNKCYKLNYIPECTILRNNLCIRFRNSS
jgi:hypothetical protein